MRLFITRFFLLFFIAAGASQSVQANDSDVVNCNRNFKVVILGSSTAYGVGASNEDSSWVGKFTAYLLRKNPSNQVVNLAIPGFTTYNNLCPIGFVPPAGRPNPVTGFTITDALAAQPDAIIINMPSNDAANDYTLQEQQDNFERAMHLADSANVPVWVSTTQPRNNLNSTQMANLIAMRDWLLTRFGNKAVDFFTTIANPDGTINIIYDFDDVHLNDAGHDLLYTRVKAETILDSLCLRFEQQELVARAGADQSITLPVNSVTLDGSASSVLNGTITGYEWRKISGPGTITITSPNSVSTTVTNLLEGRYSFELGVTKDNILTRYDTVNITVSSRVLIDFGPDNSGTPDVNGNYWNNVSNGLAGVKLASSITVGNSASPIGLEIMNRIDGTFNIAGPGTNNGNTTGDVGDYVSTATSDFAFAHSSASNGQWKITGLDPLKEYHIKFWGSRTGISDPRVIEIKQADQSVWQAYNATENVIFTNAANFTVVNKTEVTFDIRVQSGSVFGYIDLIDINYTVYQPGSNIPPLANAGPDTSVTLPTNTVLLNGSASTDYNGSIVNYEWTKISGPASFSIATPNAVSTQVNNLALGIYQFELKVTDDEGAIDRDTVTVTVNNRILFDFGPTVTTDPDVNGNYWNNVTTGTEGVKVANAVSIDNASTGISLEIMNRIDGTFNIAGPGTNTGNTTGAVGDYVSTATTDFAFAHSSASNGQWKLSGLEPLKQYTIKFWGSRTGVADPRVIEIKRADQSVWQSYDATDNVSYNNAVTFTVANKTEISFDIRVQAGSVFGYIDLIDISYTTYQPGANIPPVANAGPDKVVTLPSTSVTLNGSSSIDFDGSIVGYEWTKISGPASFSIATPTSVSTLVNNLVLGVYKFELKVTDDAGAVSRDTATVTVSNRILFDFGPTLSTDPDANGNYWNNVTTGTEGVKISNAVSTGNTPTGISLEIISRIDGTFNTAGPGTNTGNTVGDVQDYLSNATTDFAFAHPSTTSGQWKIAGLDAGKQYTVKFWGTRSVSDPRVIEIKRNDESTWQSYDAQNNSNYNTAATFTITGQTEMLFDIRVGGTSPFGYISLIDINVTEAIIPCTASVSISAAPGNTICEGTSVTFTATPTNGGSNPTYQWFNGANPIAGETSSTYTSSSLQNGDAISVEMTSNDPCATIATVTSNVINLTVNPNLPVSVSISANPGNTICEGTSVTFTATPTNGGSTPTYQWFNGANPIVGETSSTYTSSTLVNGDAISVQLTSNEVCATGNPATSNTVAMTVNPNLPVSVSISANPGNTICEGTSVTFTATPTNGGSNPSYQWFVNGIPSGTNSATFTSSSLINADLVTVQVTSNALCAVGSPATSNSISMTVLAFAPVSVSVSANPGDVICQGTSVTFSATPTNGGSNPTYQWFLDSNPISGATNETYNTSVLANGDQISVQLTSNALCVTGNPATSNVITMTIAPSLPAAVSISADPGSSICPGSTVTFTATPVNGGSNPQYQWKLNGTDILGANASTYVSSSLQIGDQISVEMISNAPCVSVGTVNSNTITISWLPIAPRLGQIAGPTSICNLVGTTTTATYSVSPVINASQYIWEVPAGVSIVSGQGSTSISVLFDVSYPSVDTIKVLAGPCTVSPPSRLEVNKVLPPIPGSISGPTEVCAFVGQLTTATYSIAPVNGISTYQWTAPDGAQIVNGQGSTSVEISFPVNFSFGSVKVVSVANCGNSNQRSLTVSVNRPDIPGSISGPASACEFVGTGNTAVYSIAPVNNASSYEWIVPANASIVNGQGTTSIEVIFTQGYLTDEIRVRSVSNCGNSSYRSFTVSGYIPSTPGGITGPTNSCIYINSGTLATYSIRKVSNALSYIWTVPAGITIVDHPAGLGVNDTIISVTFNSAFVAGSSITVQAAGCGVSLPRSLSIVSVGVPLTPGAITGPSNACPMVGRDTTVFYSISKVNNATFYTWATSAGITILSHPAGTGANDTIVEVFFSSGFTTGTVSVLAENGCGNNGTARSLTVRTLFPKVTPTITGPTDPCPWIGTAGATYTIQKIPNATSYTWTVPSVGATAFHPNPPGINDTIIIVTFTSDFTTGSITARADALCGSGSTRTLTLTRRLPATPTTISTLQTATCPNRVFVYSLPALPLNANSVTWAVPAGATIVSGQNTLQLTVAYPATAVTGSIQVWGVNNCSLSLVPRTLAVSLPACPAIRGTSPVFTEKPVFSGLQVEAVGIEVSAMPNPSTNYFRLTVESQDKVTALNLKVYDLNGRIIETRRGLKAGQAIQVGQEYGKGFFIAEFTQGSQRRQVKLIKQ